MEGTYLEEPGVTDTSVYTVNGIATVSVNSGTAPGTVRVEVSVDCDEDGDYEINANAVPVIIASGAPYYIEPEYDPNSTTPIGGGFYKTQCAAIVYDKWYNPVEDSTYVYWSIDPIAPDTLIDAFVEGISLLEMKIWMATQTKELPTVLLFIQRCHWRFWKSEGNHLWS